MTIHYHTVLVTPPLVWSHIAKELARVLPMHVAYQRVGMVHAYAHTMPRVWHGFCPVTHMYVPGQGTCQVMTLCDPVSFIHMVMRVHYNISSFGADGRGWYYLLVYSVHL